MTLVLLVLLGYGRARIGQCPMIPTILTTVLLAGCAAAAGITMGLWIDQLSQGSSCQRSVFPTSSRDHYRLPLI
jgi:hypothetical protein